MADTPYGYFDAANREYVITRPDTPTPWMNYLGEGQYGGIISNTAGGYSFDRDPRNRRVTRYRYNSVPVDQPGRYIYLRDMDSGDYWSPSWQPVVGRTFDSYECRHGTAYTRISSAYKGIETSILYFIPMRRSDLASCELWVMRLENKSDRPRRLRSFTYVEFAMYDAMSDMTNLDWGQHVLHSRYENGIIYTGTQFRPTITYFSSNLPPAGFDSTREAFIGRYRDLANPEVVECGQSTGSEAPRGNNIGSLCHDFTLAPGESREIVYMLGVAETHDAIAPTRAYYADIDNVRGAFDALRADWDVYLSRFTVTTPDPEMNDMLNFWNPVQCRTTLYWSRFVSAYETGMGRGMGTRDTAQDTLGTMHTVPNHAREMLTKIWRMQFQDGHTWHQFFPLTGEGGPGLAGEFPTWPQWFCDDHLWLIISVVAYLRETGDFAYLDQRVPFVDDGADDTIWGHMLRAVDFTLNHRGPHGLPRLGFSDWDDTMNLDHGSGKAESVWCGEQFCRAMIDLADLCATLGKQDDAAHFRSLKDEMAAIIDQTSWDGEWYTRAYDDAGDPVGVQGSKYQRIALNPQTWAVLGEIADGKPDVQKRVEQAMNNVHEKLNSRYGVALLWPAYREYDARIQGTTTYPAGAKENGGIFCHANAWVIVAAAKLGWADRAMQYYKQILPLARTDSDHYMVEPYVYCQNICGPEHAQFGYGRNSWLTGTAAWTYVAGTQWILGIRPTFEGLQIAPVIPADWPGFSAMRVFRGVTYNITVKREGQGNTVSLTVDGKAVSGDIVPLPAGGQGRVEVEVVLS